MVLAIDLVEVQMSTAPDRLTTKPKTTVNAPHPTNIGEIQVSGIGLLRGLARQFPDLAEWRFQQLRIGSEWINESIRSGQLPDEEEDYRWSESAHASGHEFNGRYGLVSAFDVGNRIVYELTRDSQGTLITLVKVLADDDILSDEVTMRLAKLFGRAHRRIFSD